MASMVQYTDSPVANPREEIMRKVRKLRALASLGASAEKLHLFAFALAEFDGASADELHSIVQRVEQAFDAMEIPVLHI